MIARFFVVITCVLLSIIFSDSVSAQGTPHANPLTVDIVRNVGKELLGPNSIPYMEPLVKTINAASNSRFFRTAHVPKKVDRPYFRFGLHAMLGFVPESMRSYKPTPPTATFEQVANDTTLFKVVSFLPTPVVEIRDTAGLITGLLKYLFKKGLEDPTSGIVFPQQATTIYGSRKDTFFMRNHGLDEQHRGGLTYFEHQITQGDPQLALIFNALPQNVRDTVLSAVRMLPEQFPMPFGTDISTVIGAVPQLEIGSLFGTEALIRFIPPIEIDPNVGVFTFWGFGLKHSLSQYFEGSPFDAALQLVYQGSSLDRVVGTTKATMETSTTMFHANVQVSKSFEGIIDVFGGLAVDNITIDASYTYLIPTELQIQLGLLRNPGVGVPAVPEPELGYPGDTKPQVSRGTFSMTNLKFTIGIAKQIGPVALFLDYNVSAFDILSFGIDVTF